MSPGPRASFERHDRIRSHTVHIKPQSSWFGVLDHARLHHHGSPLATNVHVPILYSSAPIATGNHGPCFGVRSTHVTGLHYRSVLYSSYPSSRFRLSLVLYTTVRPIHYNHPRKHQLRAAYCMSRGYSLELAIFITSIFTAINQPFCSMVVKYLDDIH